MPRRGSGRDRASSGDIAMSLPHSAAPGDAAALRVATFGMWADRALAEKMGDKAQSYMERHHSAASLAAQLTSFLEAS